MRNYEHLEEGFGEDGVYRKTFHHAGNHEPLHITLQDDSIALGTRNLVKMKGSWRERGQFCEVGHGDSSKRKEKIKLLKAKCDRCGRIRYFTSGKYFGKIGWFCTKCGLFCEDDTSSGKKKGLKGRGKK